MESDIIQHDLLINTTDRRNGNMKEIKNKRKEGGAANPVEKKKKKSSFKYAETKSDTSKVLNSVPDIPTTKRKRTNSYRGGDNFIDGGKAKTVKNVEGAKMFVCGIGHCQYKAKLADHLK